MTQTISNKGHWQHILVQQKLANARRWLALVESHDDPTALVSNDYDNFLRALETTLQNPDTFELAYQLIQSIYVFALDYADWDRWLIYLDKALATSQQLKKDGAEATLLIQIGDIHYRMGELKYAQEAYKTASKKFEILGNLAGYASSLAKLGILFDLQGDMQQGVFLCKKALKIVEAIGEESVAAQVNLYLSSIYHRARSWEAALDTAEKAYAYYEQHGPQKFARKALMNSVAIWAELGKWEEVERVSVKLIEALTFSGDIRTLSQLKNNLGVVAFNQANYQAAESSWQEALHLHSQIQEPTELASLYNNLGVVYTILREWTAAQEMLSKAIEANKQLGDVYNWANSMDNLADLYEAQGETAVCRQVLKEARAGLQSIADSPHAQELLNSITQRLKSLPPEG